MSYAADLLDGFDLLNKRTEGVLKTASSVSEFFHKLSQIEKDYSKSILSLAQKQKQSFQKAGASQKEVSTTESSWDTILSELERIAEHHRVYSEQLDKDISTPIATWAKEKQVNKKKLGSDSDRITKEMKMQLDNLKKARSKYVDLSKESDAAENGHTKGKGDINMKPNQLAKLAQKASQCADKAAQSDNEYQQVLSQTNQKQSEFYLNTMPSLLGEYQQFEEDRLTYMKTMLEKYADVTSERPSFYSSTCDSITSAARSIVVDSDINAYVSENRTGVSVPLDIQYLSYDSEVPSQPKSKPKTPTASGSGSGTPPQSKGKYTPYKPTTNDDIISSREWGLSNSDKNLSADAQRDKLQNQLDELDKAISAETKVKEGLENLVRFYASDPVAQKKAEDEIGDIEQKMNRIYDTRNNVQSQMDSLGGGDSGASRSSTGPAKKVRVKGLYDYAATCDTELSFKEGDVLNVTEQDDSGWWYAELNGRKGFVPNNYVELM